MKNFDNLASNTWANLYRSRSELATYLEAIKDNLNGLEELTEEASAELTLAESELQVCNTPEAENRYDNAYKSYDIATANYDNVVEEKEDFTRLIELLDEAIDIIHCYAIQ